LGARDLPGFKPGAPAHAIRDPYAWGLIVLGDVNSAADTQLLKRAGFVAGAMEKLAAPVEAYGSATVTQLGSAAEAQAGETKVYLRSFVPCPTNCGIAHRVVAVPGIPGAKGAVSSGKNGGGGSFREYFVTFTTGPYLYTLTAGGNTGRVKLAQVLHGARNWYARVRGL
jgi:hypothetical protein